MLDYFQKLQEAQIESQKKVTCLLVGAPAVGKTPLLATAPKPVLIHSFDPSGSLSIPRQSDIYIDTSFEDENVTRPQAFKRWHTAYQQLKANKAFDQISTYCVDSLSLFIDSIINEVMINAKSPNSPPGQREWGDIFVTLRKWIKDILSLPCHVILTAHLVSTSDGDGNSIEQMSLPTQMRARIPAMVSEIYRLYLKNIPGIGPTQCIQIMPSPAFPARSKKLMLAGNIEREIVKPNLNEIFNKPSLEG